MKVLQILPSLGFGGVERYVVDLIHSLSKLETHNKSNDLENLLIQNFIASAGGILFKDIKENCVNYINIPLNKKQLTGITKSIFLLNNFVIENKIELIHSHSRLPGWIALLIAKRRKIPFITTYHGCHTDSSYIKNFYNSIMARGDKVIAISHYMERYIKKHHPKFTKNIVFIPEGIDIEKFSPKQVSEEDVKLLKKTLGVHDHDKIILLPARLSRRKGQVEFINAMSKLEHENYIGVILGSEDNYLYKKELEDLVFSLDIQHKIRFIENFHNMPLIYKASFAVVSASNQPESFGRILVEAGAMGCCIRIGTNLGATPELLKTIDNSEVGILVKPNDANDLLRGINEAISFSHDMRNNMIFNATNHILKHYDLKAMTKKIYDLYSISLIS